VLLLPQYMLSLVPLGQISLPLPVF
jgi:hypothetical protein